LGGYKPEAMGAALLLGTVFVVINLLFLAGKGISYGYSRICGVMAAVCFASFTGRHPAGPGMLPEALPCRGAKKNAGPHAGSATDPRSRV
jgi:hypothetical protein